MKLRMILCFCLLGSTHAKIDIDSLTKTYTKSVQKSSKQRKIDMMSQSISRYEMLNSYTDFLPQVDLTLSQVREQDQTGVEPSPLRDKSKRTQKELSLSFTQSIYNYSNIINAQLAKRRNISDKLSVRSFDELISTQVRSYILSILIQSYKIHTLNESKNLFNYYLKKTKQAYKLKERLKIDVDSIRANILVIDSRISTEEQNLEVAYTLFQKYVSADDIKDIKDIASLVKDNGLDWLDKYIDQLVTKDINKFEDKKSTLSHIKSSSLYYKQLINNYVIEDLSAKASKSQLHPRFNIRGSISRTANTWDNVTTLNNTDRSVGLYLTIPLFSGGKQYTARKQADQMNSLAKIKKRQLVDNLVYDVVSLSKRFARQRSHVKTLREHIRVRKSILKSTRQSYKYKRITIDDFILQTNSYFESLITYSSSLSQLDSIANQIDTLAGKNN